MRILIVDDDIGTVNALKALLVSEGHTVSAEYSGLRALQAIKELNRSNDQIDLMITDLKMPGMNGHELIHITKKIMPRLPIILITAYGAGSLEKEINSFESCRLLEKPLVPEELIREINALLY